MNKLLYKVILCCFVYIQTMFSQAPSEVKIGSQIWTTKNLDVSTFRNGDTIYQAKTIQEWKDASEKKQAAWCYFMFDVNYGKKYGKLYNGYAVIDSRNLAPAGYHIPRSSEWGILFEHLGGDENAGHKMKSTTGWKKNGNGSNTSRFNALPSGYYKGTNTFTNIEVSANWWSSIDRGDGLDGFELGYNHSGVGEAVYYMHYGLAVRCLKD
jgi:uncharacterized protein (TIGR02145 family)